MLKRVILLTVISALICTLTVSALSGGVSIDVGDDFVATDNSKNLTKIAKILNMEKSELSSYLSENGIAYLAVNNDNSKQIKIVCAKSGFSESIGNLSSLTDSEIDKISENLIGENRAYTLVSKGSQRLVKTKYSDADSGGKYTVTSYITVANGTNYILTFYTANGLDDEYISKAFKTYTCSEFSGAKTGSTTAILVAAIAVLAGIASVITYTLVRDLIALIATKKSKNL